MRKNIKDITNNKKNSIDLRKKHLEKEGASVIKKNIVKNKLSLDDLSSEKSNFIFKKSNLNSSKYEKITKLITITILALLIVSCFFIANTYFKSKKIKNSIEDKVKNSYFSMLEAGKNTSQNDFENARNEIKDVIKNIDEIQKELWFVTNDTTIYSRNTNISGALSNILESGEHFVNAGEYFVAAVEEFNKVSMYIISGDEKFAKILKNTSITDLLKQIIKKIKQATNEIDIANKIINKIEIDTLPASIKEKVLNARVQINLVTKTLNDINSYFPSLLKLLGDKHPHTYMIIFQNNNEIRPTGGFIGSYMLFNMNDGHIENMKVYDTYDIDGSFGRHIEPPEEMKEFTDNWRMRDANYSPDFKVSGAKIKWFLEEEGGPTVDTIIAMNQGILYDMLNITGPINVGDFGNFTAENYDFLLSYIIESKLWGEEDPKHILKVFVEKFKDEILKEEHLTIILTKILRAVKQKHIMLYSRDTEIESMFSKLGISGEVRKLNKNEDYFSVINISLNGIKNEKFIEEYITHTTDIGEKGDIVDEITIERENTWNVQIYNKWLKILEPYGFDSIAPNVLNILGRGESNILTRVYVPKGSKLIYSSIENTKVKYDKELGKTYFIFKTKNSPDEKSEVKIRYSLPFKFDDNKPLWEYKLYADKQPGSRGSIFTKLVDIDLGLKIEGTYPQDLRISKDGDIIYPTNLVYDRYFSALIKN